ncbi:hypothetical protein OE749_15610 [Aestuariibacter sp. AA17]|uniref:Uncharacterized protein n=1 Tax=Fluctibacter corallii TaxID=2984329 RepID=A0ABT3ABY4_9ALTE|nr:hypothetical protein [Aestuariibacter sp. AA17]MCV2886119.1 hypothetical protein [Aestuariibacter sp. AA17]
MKGIIKSELSIDELHAVSGGVAANIAGAVAGGIGGFYGSIIGGGNSASGWDIAAGTVTGMAAGFFNPVRGFSSAAVSIGGGLAGGGITSVTNNIKRRLSD